LAETALFARVPLERDETVSLQLGVRLSRIETVRCYWPRLFYTCSAERDETVSLEICRCSEFVNSSLLTFLERTVNARYCTPHNNGKREVRPPNYAKRALTIPSRRYDSKGCSMCYNPSGMVLYCNCFCRPHLRARRRVIYRNATISIRKQHTTG
jgi:hypothetical protein